MPSRLHPLQAVIFDFDGVVVDSEPLHYKAFMETLAPFHLQHDYDVYVERYIGFDDRDAFRAIFEDAGRPLPADLFERLIYEKQGAFKRIVSKELRPFPGVHRLVQELVREEVPLAIASGSAREEILLMLDVLGLKQSFPVIVTADDVARSKPDPESYILAVRLLRDRGYLPNIASGPPEGCLVIEDTPTGIEAAKAAGLFVVAVAHSFPVEALGPADRAVPALSDLSGDLLRSFIRDADQRA
ncbi:haloacid dehalogenase superfamily, subfamily IA, variant 3 with third motif having DD or ED [Desulfacinum infernum DSM 9756]|uniref:Haloacid dehalogenase superfamily, subfamily IA, variant 3 with third motif having DD or ED n=1 Tax=Desulfacinum infernum DSM 9756 TaxID=1121391 RepID=A0A1M4VHA0_9BACT|nr:HAD family phosphatase [Desulfacinum infernum]SHE68424.1 haloacid dehalogenase superfamily, subfamily IA, variant 3 with third motif having DD or ED [Desulfacinum infernum DSM 9756]